MSRSNVRLRDVVESDLPIFFAHQLDPVASAMAAFPARGWNDFYPHWLGILSNETVFKKTILCNGQVAGNVVSWEEAGMRAVGYWLGKEYWGHGIATAALSIFLGHVGARPLYAHVSKRNIASVRVLEKCGFVLAVEGKNSFVEANGVELLMVLRDQLTAEAD